MLPRLEEESSVPQSEKPQMLLGLGFLGVPFREITASRNKPAKGKRRKVWRK